MRRALLCKAIWTKFGINTLKLLQSFFIALIFVKWICMKLKNIEFFDTNCFPPYLKSIKMIHFNKFRVEILSSFSIIFYLELYHIQATWKSVERIIFIQKQTRCFSNSISLIIISHHIIVGLFFRGNLLQLHRNGIKQNEKIASRFSDVSLSEESSVLLGEVSGSQNDTKYPAGYNWARSFAAEDRVIRRASSAWFPRVDALHRLSNLVV